MAKKRPIVGQHVAHKIADAIHLRISYVQNMVNWAFLNKSL